MNKNNYLQNKTVTEFIDYLTKFIIADRNNIFRNGILLTEFEDKKARNFEDLAGRYFFKRMNLIDTNNYLHKISKDIKGKIDNYNLFFKSPKCCNHESYLKKLNDEKEVFKICLEILEWGGVTNAAYKFGMLLVQEQLPQHLIQAQAFFRRTNFLRDDYDLIGKNMNAAWSKVYSLVCDTPFVILDSRVSASLQFLAGAFWLSKTREIEFPEELQFPELEDRSGGKLLRNGSLQDQRIVFKKISGRKPYNHAKLEYKIELDNRSCYK